MVKGQNGIRIKTFGGSADPNSIAGGGSGSVRVGRLIAFFAPSRFCLDSLTSFVFVNQNVTFQDFWLTDIDHPILIDQVSWHS